MFVIKNTQSQYLVESDESIVCIGSKYLFETEEEAKSALAAVGTTGMIIEEYKEDS